VSSPWWLAGILLLGLLSLFMGERGFSHTAMAGKLSWLGCILVASSVAIRLWVVAKSEGSQRRIEGIAVLCHVGVVIALAGYWLTTSAGMSLLGIESASAVARWQMAMRVLWIIFLFCSLVPLLLLEIALGFARRLSFHRPSAGPDASVQVLHVREMASAGLSIALATAMLMVTCNVAEQHNIRRDVSYFKTSSPGSATINMVRSLSEPLEVLLFFPENNEVAPEVLDYLRELRKSSHNLTYSLHDRLTEPELAKEHKVRRDGMVVLTRGESSDHFTINPNMDIARKRTLRELDSKFQKVLMSVIRDAKTAYFLVGHGELNDPKSAGVLGSANPLAKSTLISQVLKQLNYKVKDYEGFGKPVPDDCSLLFVLAPHTALLDEELQALDRYLARGGSAIFAFDPKAELRLGLLSSRLGVVFNPQPLADDKEFMVRSRGASDHALILTNQFLSHASISPVSRGSAQSAILFVSPGSFDDAPLAAANKDNKISKVIRSMKTAFRDGSDSAGARNFTFDKATENRGRYNLVVTVENAAAGKDKATVKGTAVPKEGEKPKGMRVALIADSEILSDAILGRIAVAQNLIMDLIKWSGGEESFSGETISEKDNRIEHTKSEDAIWFYGTMVAAPLLMLGLGLLFVKRRKTRITRRRQS